MVAWNGKCKMGRMRMYIGMKRTLGFQSSVRPSSVTLVLPPWILKWGGLESSDRRIISLIGKTKKIAFFFLFGKYFFLLQNYQIV